VTVDVVEREPSRHSCTGALTQEHQNAMLEKEFLADDGKKKKL
jgi:hypothetical protein